MAAVAVTAEVPAQARRVPVTAGEVLPRWVRLAGRSVLGVQLLGMLAFSTLQYQRFALTKDFAAYSQAWWAIGHGRLDPYSTVFGVSFWRSDAEFAMWPLSLLSHVYPHAVTLLWVQDVAVVVTELVAFAWIVKVIERRPGAVSRRTGPLLAFGAVVVLVIEPWVYDTIAFDFHFEAIAALFCVLVGYDLWSGRTRRLWLWVPLALISNALGGVYLVGVGISGVLAGRRTRRWGLAVAAVGLTWVVVLSTFAGVGLGEHLGSSYGYLLGPHHGRAGLFAIVVGALGHPGAVAHMVVSHGLVIFDFLVVVGAIGVVSPWGCGMAVVVLVPNALDASGLFVRTAASFQTWPALPFVLIGSVMVLVRLLEGEARSRRVALDVAVAWAALLGVLAVLVMTAFGGDWLSVDPATAAALSHVESVVPSNAEVICSQGVVGRFGLRDSVYAFTEGHQTLPVDRRVVVFVLAPEQGIDDVLPDHEATVAVRFVESRHATRVLYARSHVYAVEWTPPPGTRQVTLP